MGLYFPTLTILMWRRSVASGRSNESKTISGVFDGLEEAARMPAKRRLERLVTDNALITGPHILPMILV